MIEELNASRKKLMNNLKPKSIFKKIDENEEELQNTEENSDNGQ